jgi:hypothetical protein
MSALQWADPNLEIYILQTLHLIFSNINGKIHVLKSEQVLNYVCKSLIKQENVNVANEAALLMIDILKEPCKHLTVNSFRGNSIASEKGACCEVSGCLF